MNFIAPKIIRSHRKSLTIQISPNGDIIVKAPYLLPEFIINRFLKQKSIWIEKQQKRMSLRPKKQQASFDEGSEFWYLGKPYKLLFGNYHDISITTHFHIPYAFTIRLKKELKIWYIKKAKELITQRVILYAKDMGTTYTSLRYSDTQSKWGSCSPQNDLQFSWRLIMAPLIVIDYVVVHELAHTKEKNHQKAFWQIVAQHKPAYKQYIKWLKENGNLLQTML